MEFSILAPGAVLVLWSLIMMIWMASTRFPAITKAGLDLKASPPGGRGGDLEGVLPPSVNWKAHNYTHLMEQPTIFYAAIIFLHLSGGATQMMISFAWAYTILRIMHSIWQATVNTIIPVRAGLFMLSSICLLILAVNAVIVTI